MVIPRHPIYINVKSLPRRTFVFRNTSSASLKMLTARYQQGDSLKKDRDIFVRDQARWKCVRGHESAIYIYLNGTTENNNKWNYILMCTLKIPAPQSRDYAALGTSKFNNFYPGRKLQTGFESRCLPSTVRNW